MGGTGARPHELSIRGKRGTYVLHLQRFGGQDSSLPLTTPVGHVPTIVGLVDLDVAQPYGTPTQPPHPSPADDEALVDLGVQGFVGAVGMFGTDANGCLAAYTFETKSGSEPFEVPYRDESWFRSGWSYPYGMVHTFDAARQTDGSWHLSKQRLHRAHPTGAGSHGGGWWNVPSTAEVPEIGEGC